MAATIQDGDPQVAAAVGNCNTARSQARPSNADETSTRFLLDTISNAAYVPSIRAAVELSRDQPGKAIELLQSASLYERAYPESIYLRGVAYLRLRKDADPDVPLLIEARRNLRPCAKVEPWKLLRSSQSIL